VKFAKSAVLYVLAILWLVIAGYPYAYMFATSLKDQPGFFRDPTGLIGKYTLDSYRLVFELGLFRYFANSVIISAICVTLVILLACMVSYCLARVRFLLNRPLYFLFIAGMMIPVHTTLIPVCILTSEMGLYDRLWALVGPYIAFSLPVSVIILTQFAREIPGELEEAAVMDGAGRTRTFVSVILPLLAPATATVGIYNFIHIWNEFVFALILISTRDRMTLPLGLREFYAEFSVNVPGVMAALTLGLLPLLIAYFISQEKVVSGISAGAVKG
jgi:raffinose/stachyose/melibiose transport system permease protein